MWDSGPCPNFPFLSFSAVWEVYLNKQLVRKDCLYSLYIYSWAVESHGLFAGEFGGVVFEVEGGEKTVIKGLDTDGQTDRQTDTR